MKETAYAYAVSRIRANETKLLSGADIDQLIAAPDEKSAVKLLEDKGYIDIKVNGNLNNIFQAQLQNTWQLLCEIAPDIGLLDFWIIKNDFHNLKTALKAFFTEDKNTDYFIQPALCNPQQIKSAVFGKCYSELPVYLKEEAEKAYDVLIRTMDGQLADILLDAAALNTMLQRAGKTGNGYIKNLAELACATANIKIAIRAARTGKDMQFLQTALCDTASLNITVLINESAKGLDCLFSYLCNTVYKEAVAQYKISTSAFEKWCDDLLLYHVQSAKFISFGPEPLITYYLAKEAEIKSLRIILSCKHNKLPSEKIRERVRRLYV
jgi:V/A-type H+-transporting ATPase subunit C